MFLIHLGHRLPLDFHSRPNLSPRNAKVPRQNHPLLDLLCIAHSFSISLVNAFLDAPHNVGIRTIDDVFHGVCIATNRPTSIKLRYFSVLAGFVYQPAPVQSCGGQLAGGLHGVGVHLDSEGEEGGAELLLVPQEQDLADDGELGLDSAVYWLGGDVLPSSRDDQVLLSAHYEVVAVTVNVHQVPGPQPTILSHVLPGGVLPVGVAHHHVPPPHAELLGVGHLGIAALRMEEFSKDFIDYWADSLTLTNFDLTVMSVLTPTDPNLIFPGKFPV